jgi:hypothetical protein
MIKFTTAVFTAALMLTPAFAADVSPKQSFVHEGTTYTYSVDQKKGYRVLRGVFGKGYRPFNLTVTEKHVSGTVDGSSVAFRLDEVRPLRGTVTIATR